jgi:hypothetical protein
MNFLDVRRKFMISWSVIGLWPQYVHVCVCIYTYIYTHREQPSNNTHTHTWVRVHVYAYKIRRYTICLQYSPQTITIHIHWYAYICMYTSHQGDLRHSYRRCSPCILRAVPPSHAAIFKQTEWVVGENLTQRSLYWRPPLCWKQWNI